MFFKDLPQLVVFTERYAWERCFINRMTWCFVTFHTFFYFTMRTVVPYGRFLWPCINDTRRNPIDCMVFTPRWQYFSYIMTFTTKQQTTDIVLSSSNSSTYTVGFSCGWFKKWNFWLYTKSTSKGLFVSFDAILKVASTLVFIFFIFHI